MAVYNVYMADTGTLTIRLPKEQIERLELLARDTRRSRSYLAGEAIAQYLEYEEWKIQAIKEGIAAADRGDLVPHEKVVAWIESWGTEHELPRPRA